MSSYNFLMLYITVIGCALIVDNLLLRLKLNRIEQEIPFMKDNGQTVREIMMELAKKLDDAVAEDFKKVADNIKTITQEYDKIFDEINSQFAAVSEEVDKVYRKIDMQKEVANDQFDLLVRHNNKNADCIEHNARFVADLIKNNELTVQESNKLKTGAVIRVNGEIRK